MLRVTHTNAGFFSCCSVRLMKILEYFNENKRVPHFVDSSEQFILYRPPDVWGDLCSHFFKFKLNDVSYSEDIKDCNDNQFRPYKSIHFESLNPFIERYFSPSDEIVGIANLFIQKYKLAPPGMISVYYRGTDKYKETPLAAFEDYSTMIDKIYKGEQILVQSDSAPFLSYMRSKYQIVAIEENPVSDTSNGIHNENNSSQNYNEIKYLLATVMIMARSKTVICSSGNVSIWLAYYRNSANNLYQNLNNSWL